MVPVVINVVVVIAIAAVVEVILVAYFQIYSGVAMNVILEDSEEQDAIDESLAKFKTVSDETTVISEIPSATDIEEAFIVPPDE